MKQTTEEHPPKISLHLPLNLKGLDLEDPNSLKSISLASSSLNQTERELFFLKTLEILTKAGEQRNPRDINLLMNFTENFQYFQRLKEKQSTSVLHSRFCRVMKLRILKKGDTLFYAGFFLYIFFDFFDFFFDFFLIFFDFFLIFFDFFDFF